MNQKTVVLKHGATLDEEIKALRTLFDRGYSYDRTEHCHDIDLIILNNWDTNRKEQMKQDIDRLHTIITDLTSEKDAYEEMLQQTQQELEEQKQINKSLSTQLLGIKAMAYSRYVSSCTVHPDTIPDPPTQDCVQNETLITEQHHQQFQPDPTRPDKTGEGVEQIECYNISYNPNDNCYYINCVGINTLLKDKAIFVNTLFDVDVFSLYFELDKHLFCKVIEVDKERCRSKIVRMF